MKKNPDKVFALLYCCIWGWFRWHVQIIFCINSKSYYLDNVFLSYITVIYPNIDADGTHGFDYFFGPWCVMDEQLCEGNPCP